MDIKKLLIIAAIAFLAIIGFNYYSSAQSEKARAARAAEIESLKAKNAQQAALVQKTKDDNLAAKNSAATQDVEKSKSSICDSVTGVAESAMRARLSGVSIQTALSSLDKINDSDENGVIIKNLYKAVITDAYRLPNFSTDKYKEEAIREFSLKQYLACTDAMAKI